MFTRIVSFTDAKDIDVGIEYTRDTVAPLLHQQKGFRGVTVSTDRSAGQLFVMTLWETEADRDASESAMGKVREEATRLIGGRLDVEFFEEVYAELVAGPPAVGSSLLVTRVSMDPASIEENVARFRTDILPLIKANPGLLGIRHMVNRQTGQALVGAVLVDAASMRAAVEAAEARQGSSDLPVTIQSRSQRTIELVDLS